MKTSPVKSVILILWTATATAAITTTCFQWNYLDFDRIFSLFSLMNFFDKIKATETAFKWKTVTLKIYFHYMANLIVVNRSFEVNSDGKILLSYILIETWIQKLWIKRNKIFFGIIHPPHSKPKKKCWNSASLLGEFGQRTRT